MFVPLEQDTFDKMKFLEELKMKIIGNKEQKSVVDRTAIKCVGKFCKKQHIYFYQRMT